MSRSWCLVCGTALHRKPSADGRGWWYVAESTETRYSDTPLQGYLGPPIFVRYEIAEDSVWTSNRLPLATAGPADGRYYGHGVPVGTGWWSPLVGHVHVPGRSVEAVLEVPDCCGWPMRATPTGWCCRVDKDCAAAAPLAA